MTFWSFNRYLKFVTNFSCSIFCFVTQFIKRSVKMKYQSTRGGGELKSFDEVLVSTYACDGGLYVPTKIPMFTKSQLQSWINYSFPQVCSEILHLYTDIDASELLKMAEIAFSEFNDGNVPLPLTYVDNLILLDTSLGPTLSFKDIGQHMTGQLMNHVLGKKNKKANIVIETSGDTGPAAISGVKKCPNVEIFCLYPYQRVSDVQELQMITVEEANVHVFRTEGDSDEQASVLKELFRDTAFLEEYNICSVNSINWARIATQSSYYVWSYLQIMKDVENIGKPINFIVPTGAFGNAMGGFLAKKMGLPIQRIVCATNANDIVHRTLTTGDMSMGTNLATVSPAMDIQFAYNLERMLFYICNENPDIVRPIMTAVEEQYSYVPGAPGAQLDPFIVSRIQELFSSVSVSDFDTLLTIKHMKRDKNILLCPHSAIAVHAGQNEFAHLAADGVPTVCVLTAHPAKFESAIVNATGEKPPLPASVIALQTKPHRFEWMQKNDENWRAEWIAIVKASIVAASKN